MDLWGGSRNTGMWGRWVLKVNVTIPLLNSHVLMVVNAWGEDERGALVPFLSF